MYAVDENYCTISAIITSFFQFRFQHPNSEIIGNHVLINIPPFYSVCRNIKIWRLNFHLLVKPALAKRDVIQLMDQIEVAVYLVEDTVIDTFRVDNSKMKIICVGASCATRLEAEV